MFFKPFHIVFITLIVLLFSLEKVSAENGVNIIVHPHHKFSDHVSSASSRMAKQIILDSLTDSNEDNGDDETSSKAKHRQPKIIISSPAKFNTTCVAITLLRFNDSFNAPISLKRPCAFSSLSGKTPISIAIRCLRI